MLSYSCLIPLFITVSTTSAYLEAILSPTRLPTRRDYTAAAYDGDELIYIMGGVGPGDQMSRDILQFNISSQDLTLIGQLQPGGIFGGTGFAHREPDTGSTSIYFAGGKRYQEGAKPKSSAIYKLNPASGEVELVAHLPKNDSSMSAVVTSTKIYFIGGEDAPQTIVSFDPASEKTQHVWELPLTAQPSTAVMAGFGGSAVIFVKRVFDGMPNVGEWILGGQSIDFVPNVATPRFLTFAGASASVWDGTAVWVVSGFEVNDGRIARFDPVEGRVDMFQVANYPGMKDDGFLLPFYGTSAVYVERQGRIYMFGGYLRGHTTGFRDEIWYIDLPQGIL